MTVTKTSFRGTLRIWLIILLALPAFAWAGLQRFQWQLNQHTLLIHIQPLPRAKEYPTISLLSTNPEIAWQATIVDSPLVPAQSPGEESGGVHRKSGERLYGPKWSWQCPRLQYRESPSQPWQDRELPSALWKNWKQKRLSVPADWPLAPGQWKQTIEVSCEIYNETESKFWRGWATHEHIVDVSMASNRAYVTYIDSERKRLDRQQELQMARWKREDEKIAWEQEQEWSVVRKRADAHNRKLEAEQDRLRGKDQRIAKLQWRIEGTEAWRDVPKSGQKDYPITVQQYEVIEMRAVRARPDLPWATVMWKENNGAYFYTGDPEAPEPIGFGSGGTANRNPTKESKQEITRYKITAKCNDQTISTYVRFLSGPSYRDFDSDFSYLKSVQWRCNAKEAWRQLPPSGVKGHSLTCRIGQGLWFRAVASDSKIGIPVKSLSWQLGDSDRENPGTRQAASLSESVEESPNTFEFFVPLEGISVGIGDELPLKIYCGNTISTIVRAGLPAPPTAAEAAGVTLKLLMSSSSWFVPAGGETMRIPVATEFSSGARRLPVWLEARDAKGLPVGQINGAGSGDDFEVSSFASRGAGLAYFSWSPGFKLGKVLLTASLRDHAGRILKRSAAFSVVVQPIILEVTTSAWRREGSGFVRDVRVKSSYLLRRGAHVAVPGIPFRVDIQTTPGTPRGASWLERNEGITGDVSHEGWLTIQHWKLQPNASLHLDNYHVVVRPKPSPQGRTGRAKLQGERP